jgi:hypothetical protein
MPDGGLLKPHHSNRRGPDRSSILHRGGSRQDHRGRAGALQDDVLALGDDRNARRRNARPPVGGHQFREGLAEHPALRVVRTCTNHQKQKCEAIIPLPRILATTLRTYWEQWKSNPDGFLFVTRNRRPPSSNKVVEYGLWPVLDLLAIPRCGLHAFRHTHTSLLLDTGATPKVVQEQLRHADPRITLGVYAHVLGDAQREAVEKVASVVFQSIPKAREETKYIQ